jgi:3-hydroxyanthranilate 3,4-dioxygenase
MLQHPHFRPFNFQRRIAENQQFLKPPVGNKQLFDTKSDMTVMIVGGPNQRVEFHDDPVEEFFYQLKGDMVLKVAEGGKIYDVPIREGDVFMIGPHTRHSPQRPIPGSVGLVVEGTRRESDIDGFEWFCFNCGERVHRVEVQVKDIAKDLPPLFSAFYANEAARKCKHCGAIHPGKEPPPGWMAMDVTAAA